jgi:hypothetical protein
MSHYWGIQGGTISLFRGQRAIFQIKPQQYNGTLYTPNSGDVGALTITHSLTPDAPSVVHTYTDLVPNGPYMQRVFTPTETRALPLGAFLFEAYITTLADGEQQVIAQGTLSVFPTAQG